MDALKRWLSDNNLTQEEFAKRLDPPVTPGAVSLWLNGRNRPNADRLKAISRATGLTTDQLLGLAA